VGAGVDVDVDVDGAIGVSCRQIKRWLERHSTPV